MLTAEYPVLEFDHDRNAFIRPKKIYEALDIAERCVLCFFSEAIERILEQCPHEILSYCKAESFKEPIYQIEYKGEKVALVQAAVGAPMAAGQIEQLSAHGCTKFIVCGSCGVLQKEIAVGHLIIPTAAVRDEGTSYHYAPPSREIEADAHVVEAIEVALTQQELPYIKAKTWTTDAFFRETPAKIKRRKEEGCVTVEMETSAYIAVARYNGVEFGQILYAGDNLGGEEWDSRDYSKRADIRMQVLQATLESAMKL
jgi:uridine phosphorylase